MAKLNFYLCFFSAFICQFSIAQIPDYYSTIDFDQVGVTLRIQLSNLISDTHHTFLPYSSSSTDTWDVIKTADLTPENTDFVLLMYGYDDDDGEYISDRTRSIDDSCHSNSCIGLWTREHVFARSLANPALTTNDPGPGTDIHNLRACDSQKNSQKSNRLFIDASGNSRIIGDYFFPGDEWKGDVARIIMYMYLRYPSQCEAIDTSDGVISYAPENDMPNLFLEWNQQDPVSELELTRNEIIYSYQGNRNPFIDNPYLANKIWYGPEANDSWTVLSNANDNWDSILISPTLIENSISVSGVNSNQFKILIFNQLGQKLLECHNEKKVDVSELPSGVYLLSFQGAQSNKQHKFIKK